MTNHIETIFSSQHDISSNAEEFYKNYWTESGSVKPETIAKNRAILGRFFPDGLTGRTVLEIGIGGEGGIVLQLLHNNEVHGLDVSDAAVNNCQRFGISVTKANLDRERIPHDDDSIDIVFAFEVFEHFSNPQHALEEIQRVLKPDGIFICSVPATCTYHWPRLFYPALFDAENFVEFLIINGFNPAYHTDWLTRNHYRSCSSLPPDITSWSWYWHATKLNPDDAHGFIEGGKFFWEKRNRFGLRTRPIEALDMFKKGYDLSPRNTEALLLYTHALLYRAINGDREPFYRMLDRVNAGLVQPDGSLRTDYIARLMQIDIEAQRLGGRILSDDDYARFKRHLSQENVNRRFLDEIVREELISRQTSGH